MDVRWSSMDLTDMMLVPKAVADGCLPTAGALPLKVLLWFARHGAPFDENACAAALKCDRTECVDALEFWMAAGVLTRADSAAPAAMPAENQPAPAPAAEEVPATATEFAPVAKARPAAVKPQLFEVTRRQQTCKEFADLLETVSMRLGKPLSGGDSETLLYLFDTCGMPSEVITMAVTWAVAHSHNNMRYIEKMALDWVDRDITTVTAAEEYLCGLERLRKAFERLEVLLDLAVARPSSAQKQAADRWFNEWQLADELIKEAYVRTLNKTGKFQVKYMDQILGAWHEDGITAVAQLQPEKKQPTKPAGGSLDTAGYDALLSDYVPTYPQKKEG
ncbi:MAG: DnaD domain protein [Clostridia bacterium]|nr:DnaD domain protein [Clostridia bacterium]